MYKKYHISIYFLRKIVFHFPPNKKYHVLQEKIAIFPDTRKIIFRYNFFEKTIFSEHPNKISYFHVFFENFFDHLSFFVQGVRSYFREKNIIFPENTRKIIFQRNFFGKTIFSRCLKKGNMIFHEVYFIQRAYETLKQNLVKFKHSSHELRS